MSRRVTFFVLAASAALIATQASAETKCVGESCAAAPSAAQLRSQWPAARSEKPAPGRRTSSQLEERLVAEASGHAEDAGRRPHRGHVRHVPPYPGYVVGLPVGPGPVVVANPPFAYGGYFGYGSYFGRPVYLFAPNAKIITLDRD